MGAAMSPEQFIKANLLKELEKMKLPFADQLSLAEEGLRYWKESAHFKKSAWADTLAYVKKRMKK